MWLHVIVWSTLCAQSIKLCHVTIYYSVQASEKTLMFATYNTVCIHVVSTGDKVNTDYTEILAIHFIHTQHFSHSELDCFMTTYCSVHGPMKTVGDSMFAIYNTVCVLVSTGDQVYTK